MTVRDDRNADFLALPERQPKPRQLGLTHVLDKGLSELGLRSLLASTGAAIDIVKLGWGTAYVSQAVPEKIAACKESGVRVSPGGTLLEIAMTQGKLAEFTRWATANGFDTVEVSDGTIDMGYDRRRRVIRQLAQEFLVVAEVGSKDPSDFADAESWTSCMLADLDAGAQYVIAEGRESGTVGIYDDRSRVREDLVSSIIERVPVERIIFEAPAKSHQVWFVDHLGVDVNLGNIAPDDVLGLETLRRGLRADTASLAVSSWTPTLVARALFERSG